MSNFRQLPSVDALLRAVRAELDAELPHALLRDEVRAVLDEVRATLQSSAVPAPDAGELAAQVLHRLQRVLTPNLRPVINAGGVIIQTNLGRAPLSAQALQAMATIGAGYSNLEYDLLAGTRGSRNTHLEALLRRLSGAESALAVNNNAAA
ncbi:MAG: L-seryl-tRNA(Sec) selenium transferase, partial [Oscillochloris sp.]|nr:L-seryl-tRNA(Sec) selenium transferase [Oscillochloris sp.]